MRSRAGTYATEESIPRRGSPMPFPILPTYQTSHPGWWRPRVSGPGLSCENQAHPRTACINEEIKAEERSGRVIAKGRRRTGGRVPTENEGRSRKDGGKRGEEEEVAQLPSATGDSGPTWGPIKGATRGPIYSEERPRASWSRLENVNRTDVSLDR